MKKKTEIPLEEIRHRFTEVSSQIDLSDTFFQFIEVYWAHHSKLMKTYRRTFSMNNLSKISVSDGGQEWLPHSFTSQTMGHMMENKDGSNHNPVTLHYLETSLAYMYDNRYDTPINPCIMMDWKVTLGSPISRVDVYRTIYGDLISSIRFAYDSFRKSLFDMLELDSEEYAIEFYKVYNEDSSRIIDSWKNRENLWRGYETIHMDNYFYRPYISIVYTNRDIQQFNHMMQVSQDNPLGFLAPFLFNVVSNTDTKDQLLLPRYMSDKDRSLEIYYRTNIIPDLRIITHNYPIISSDRVGMFDVLDSYNQNDLIQEDLTINPTGDVQTCMPKRLADWDTFYPTNFIYYNLFNKLAVAIRHKPSNKFVIILGATNTNLKLKTAPHITSFSDCITFRTLCNRRIDRVMSKEDSDELVQLTTNFNDMVGKHTSKVYLKNQSLEDHVKGLMYDKIRPLEPFCKYKNMCIWVRSVYNESLCKLNVIINLPKWQEIFLIDEKSNPNGRYNISVIKAESYYSTGPYYMTFLGVINDDRTVTLGVNALWLIDHTLDLNLSEKKRKTIFKQRYDLTHDTPKCTHFDVNHDMIKDLLKEDEELSSFIYALHDRILLEVYDSYMQEYHTLYDPVEEAKYASEVLALKKQIKEIEARNKPLSTNTGRLKVKDYTSMSDICNEVSFYFEPFVGDDMRFDLHSIDLSNL